MKNKTHVDECIHPDNVSCRGCEHSYRPDLYDGGCKLHYEHTFGVNESNTHSERNSILSEQS